MTMGYDFDELFPGRFLKSGEFKGREVTLTIASVQIEELPDEKGTPNKDGVRVRVRGIVGFKQTKKLLVLNRTNGEAVKAMFGRQTDDWIGKRVTFFPAVVDAFGGETTAIRVRGSPDLAQPIQTEVRIGRRQATLKMVPTGKPNGKPKPVVVEDPPHDPTTGDVLEPGTDADDPTLPEAV
jgi:hypothetical protein